MWKTVEGNLSLFTMNKSILFYAILLLIFPSLLIFSVSGEVDKTSIVTSIIDGDTFDIATGERIRLADVDSPEYYESGYSEAKSYLSSLIDGKTVYLDVDDVYTYDYSGKGDRLVCVAYVDYDSTHWMNVNQALLDEGHAVISNFHNEFSPYSWSLLVPKYESPEETDFSPYPFTPTPEPTWSFPRELLGIIVGIIVLFGLYLLFLLVVSLVAKRNRRFRHKSFKLIPAIIFLKMG